MSACFYRPLASGHLGSTFYHFIRGNCHVGQADQLAVTQLALAFCPVSCLILYSSPGVPSPSTFTAHILLKLSPNEPFFCWKNFPEKLKKKSLPHETYIEFIFSSYNQFFTTCSVRQFVCVVRLVIAVRLTDPHGEHHSWFVSAFFTEVRHVSLIH